MDPRPFAYCSFVAGSPLRIFCAVVLPLVILDPAAIALVDSSHLPSRSIAVSLPLAGLLFLAGSPLGIVCDGCVVPPVVLPLVILDPSAIALVDSSRLPSQSIAGSLPLAGLLFLRALRLVKFATGVLVLPPAVDLFFRSLGFFYLPRVRDFDSGVLVLAPVLFLLFRLSYCDSRRRARSSRGAFFLLAFCGGHS